MDYNHLLKCTICGREQYLSEAKLKDVLCECGNNTLLTTWEQNKFVDGILPGIVRIAPPKPLSSPDFEPKKISPHDKSQ